MSIDELKQELSQIEQDFNKANAVHLDQLQELYKLQGEWRALERLIGVEQSKVPPVAPGEPVKVPVEEEPANG